MKATKSGELKHRKLTLWDCLEKNTQEQESYRGVCVSSRMAETDTTNTSKQEGGLLEKILSPENMNRAYKQVKRNKGAGGIDGMTVDRLVLWIREHRDELLQSLRDGSYRPQPVRRVEIPKENGKTRKLVQVLSETIKDGRVISLIHKFLRAGVMDGGVFEESPEGVPHG